MERPTDPYQTLGLSRGASLLEVKRAYRRLAKEWHPDAARARGEIADPAALRRFLVIQAAYQAIVETHLAPIPATGRPRDGATRRPWSRRPGGPAAAPPSGARHDARSGAGPGPTPGPEGARTDAGEDGERERRAARLGTTSYDDAPESQPEWHGASWYGEASGTYWTVNPREYADPRKHGPEYLERTRRPDEGRES